MAPQSLYDNELETKLGVSWNRLNNVDYLAQREFVSVTRSHTQRLSMYIRLRLMGAAST